MAEPIGLASGLLTLAAFAFRSSIALGETVKSFQSHQQRVHDLIEELGALSGVLSALTETVNAVSGVDFSALDIPLLRCGSACKDFEKEVLKCASRSGDSRTSFRNWAKLRYMGEDIDGFRRLLAGYKMTVTIALTDANL
jgi:Fungal N-terminal domain of STAND proteins